MTTVIRNKLKCSCGHEGSIKMKENDAPFSRQYEDYSLENLTGTSFSVLGSAKLDEVFENMKPICPQCGTLLTQAHLII